MTVTHQQTSSSAVGGSTLTIAWPITGLAVDDYFLIQVANKYPGAPPATPSGCVWLFDISGGAGSSGTDTGNVLASVFGRLADGTETGNLSISFSGGNCAAGRISRYRKTNTSWDIAVVGGTQNSGGSVNYSATSTAGPGLAAGDILATITGINGNNMGSWGTFSYTCAGVTFGTITSLGTAATSTGDDIIAFFLYVDISSGSGAGNITLDAVAGSGTPGSDNPAGPTAFIRIRDTAGGGTEYIITPSGGFTLSGSQSLIRERAQLPSGGVSFSGSITAIRERAYAPSGSVTFSGSAPISTGSSNEYIITPSGGFDLAGVVALLRERQIVPTGQIEFSGASPQIREKIFSVSGQVTFSGSAPIVFIPAGGVIYNLSRITIGVDKGNRIS